MADNDTNAASHRDLIRKGSFPGLVAGTLIHTTDGLLPAEELRPGDLILTADHGFRPLRRTMFRSTAGHGPAAPVLITTGTLGNSRDLYLSQQHRILLSDGGARGRSGLAEVLADALHLLNGSTIRLSPCARVDYIGLILDQPELIFAEGILTESTHAARLPIRPRATQADLLSPCPEHAAPDTRAAHLF